ncbi:MAG: DUF362 domain-containing protein [Candidatus Aenigmatarchaeota archaeon]
MKPKVIFIPGTRGDFEDGKNLDKILAAMNEFGLEDFSKKKVLLKLHMGERGNKFYLKPAVVRHFVDALLAIGAKPFLFDTAVKYEGGRDTKEKYAATAKEHGFDKLGCPVVIGNEGRSVAVGMKGATSEQTYAFEVAKEVCDAEFILSVAHGKGHMMSGFGGSIKAFGMGGVSKESKGFIHAAGAPVLGNAEACRLCGECMEGCPMKAITVVKSGDRAGWRIDYGKCFGCQRCVKICPNNAIVWKGEEFDLMLAAGAAACLSNFNGGNKPKKAIFINVLVDISKRCDCASSAGPVIAPDVGVVVSDDPVAADAASIDLIEKAAGKGLKEIQNVDPRSHARYAEKLGMGGMEYDMIRY